MKITDLHVDGFGVWSGLSVNDMSDRMTLIFGHNEAGKTTLLHFIRTMLYGFSRERQHRYLPPVHGGMVGGSLYVASELGNIEIQRHVRDGAAISAEGDLALTAEDGSTGGMKVLKELLGDVDESIFNNVHAVGLREIQHLGTLNDTEAAEHLYNLTTGMDRVSLADVARELTTARRHILAPDGEPSEMALLLDEHETLETELNQLLADRHRWPELASEGGQLEKKVSAREKELKQLEVEVRRAELAVQVYPPWQARQKMGQRLKEMGINPDLDEGLLERLEKTNARMTTRREQRKTLKQQQAELRTQARQLPIDRDIVPHLCRLEAVGEHLPWLNSLESQIERLQREEARLADDLDVVSRSNGVSLDEMNEALPEISAHTMSLLTAPARAVRKAKSQLKEALATRDSCRREAVECRQRLRAALGGESETELNTSLETVGELVTQLRRRQQLDERIGKLEHTQDELEDDVDDLVEQQVLPIWQLTALGIPFVLGAMFILAGIFWSSLGLLGWPLAILGLASSGIAIAVKFMLERNTSRELETCHRQIERVREQLEDARLENDELNRVMPLDIGQVHSRLNHAEQQLAELEELLPLDAQLQEVEHRVEEAKQAAVAAAEGLKEARREWGGVLRAVGLPADLSPKNVRAMTSGYEQVNDKWRQLNSVRRELAERMQDRDSIHERVEAISRELGLELTDEDPKTRLETLLNTGTQQRACLDERRGIIRQYRRLRTRRERIRQGMQKLARRRKRLLVRAGVENEEEFRESLADLSQARELRGQREELNRQIATALGSQVKQTELEAMLQEHGEQIEQHWEALVARLGKCQTDLAELHQRRGELNQEMKSGQQDRRLDEVRFDLAGVKQQLKQATRHWQVLAVVSVLLRGIQQTFERERQPKALADASRYLDQLTEGKYKRIWTPFDEQSLLVDNAEGEALSVDVLSRGTREAVFLSLRLALASEYSSRGVELPIVLDDVLVNLDVKRAQAAARMLRDFSQQGHQLLVFTCHEHILEIFKSVQAEIRNLPSHQDVAKGQNSEAVAETIAEDAVETEIEKPLAGDPPVEEVKRAVEEVSVETDTEAEEPPEPRAPQIVTEEEPDQPHSVESPAEPSLVWESPNTWWEATPDRV